MNRNISRSRTTVRLRGKHPYGKPGDHLWVRETWAICGNDNPDGSPHTEVVFRADSTGGKCPACEKGIIKWKPSIHMPRWASRITLEVTDVRVQRVQDISEEDAIAEGIEQADTVMDFETGSHGWKNYLGDDYFPEAKLSFKSLWNSINAKRGHGWDKNDWVRATTFKVIE